MKRLAPFTFIFALALLLGPTQAEAGDALEELKGAWLVESFDGEAPPQGVSMVITFVDDSTMQMEMTFGSETKKEEIKYSATKDGKITVYPEPETEPEGETGTWEVKADKKLYITADDGVMLLKRKG